MLAQAPPPEAHLPLEATAVGGGLTVVGKNGVIEETVVKRELLACLILLRSRDETPVRGLQRRLAAVVGDVRERHHELVAVAALLAPPACHECVEAPEDVVPRELELGRRPGLDVLLVPLVEVVEGAPIYTYILAIYIYNVYIRTHTHTYIHTYIYLIITPRLYVFSQPGRRRSVFICGSVRNMMLL